MNFAAKALPMSRSGLATALELLELGPGQAAALWSVFEVETAGITQGYGFRRDRRPQILFESRKFQTFTNGQFESVAPELKSTESYGSLASQYPKLEKALALCVQAGLGVEPALKSASWGIGQVMGFNCISAGFANAKEMVDEMVQSEDTQLLGMANFMRSTGLAIHLKSRNWARFARGYNGPGYAKYQYDIKLEQQYARFSGGSMPDLEVRTAQCALTLLGFAVGKIDGVLGNRTKAALRGFQTAYSLPVTSELDSGTYAGLFKHCFE